MPRQRKRKPVKFNKVFIPFLRKLEEKTGKAQPTRVFKNMVCELLHKTVDLVKGDNDHLRLLRNVDIHFHIRMEFGEAIVETVFLKESKKATPYQKLMADTLTPRFGGEDLVVDHPQGQKKIRKYEGRIARVRSLVKEFARNTGVLDEEELWSNLEDEAEKVAIGI